MMFNPNAYTGKLVSAELLAHALVKLDETCRWHMRGAPATAEIRRFMREAWLELGQAHGLLPCLNCGFPVDVGRRDGLDGVV